MRLLLDANISTTGIGQRLAALGHDVGALAQEPALDPLTDEEVLELAAKDESILVTLNSVDYPIILIDWASSGRSHAGVIILHEIGPADFDTAAGAIAVTLRSQPVQADWTDRAIVTPAA